MLSRMPGQTTMTIIFFLSWLLLLAAAVAFSPVQDAPFRPALRQRQAGGGSSLRVDLGYELYEGVANSSTGLHTWRGSIAPEKP